MKPLKGSYAYHKEKFDFYKKAALMDNVMGRYLLYFYHNFLKNYHLRKLNKIDDAIRHFRSDRKKKKDQ